MQYTVEDLELKSERYSLEYGVDRSIGCHLMQIVNHIAQAGGLEKPHDPKNRDFLDTYATPGFIWERVISDYLSEVEHQELLRPGEMFWCYNCKITMPGANIAQDHCKANLHRGIYFTPDAVNATENALEEWKFTWKSVRRLERLDDGEKGIWRWVAQTQAYCYALGLTKATIRCFFVNGDWREFKPKPKIVRMEFTEEELNNMWNMIVRNGLDSGLL